MWLSCVFYCQIWNMDILLKLQYLIFFLREVGIMHIHATQKLTAKIRKTLHGVHTYSEGKAIVCIHLGGECGGKKEWDVRREHYVSSLDTDEGLWATPATWGVTSNNSRVTQFFIICADDIVWRCRYSDHFVMMSVCGYVSTIKQKPLIRMTWTLAQ